MQTVRADRQGKLKRKAVHRGTGAAPPGLPLGLCGLQLGEGSSASDVQQLPAAVAGAEQHLHQPQLGREDTHPGQLLPRT